MMYDKEISVCMILTSNKTIIIKKGGAKSLKKERYYLALGLTPGAFSYFTFKI